MRRLNSDFPFGGFEQVKNNRNGAIDREKTNHSFYSPSSTGLGLFRNQFLNEEMKESKSRLGSPFIQINDRNNLIRPSSIFYERNDSVTKCQICKQEIENVRFINSMNLHEENERCKAIVHFHCIFFFMKKAIESNKEGFDSLELTYNCTVCKKNLTQKKLEEVDLDVLKEKMKQCAVCFNYKHEKYLFLTEKCNHISCKQCANLFYKTKIFDERKEELTCLQCNAEVDYNILKTTVSGRSLMRYSELLLNKLVKEDKCDEVFIRCPKHNCNSIMCFPKNLVPNVIKCIACGYAFCGKGCGSGHPDMTCKEALENKNKGANEQINEQLFQLIVGRENIKVCPQCKAYSQKINGCNHVICLKCKYEYCFACLVHWKTKKCGH